MRPKCVDPEQLCEKYLGTTYDMIVELAKNIDIIRFLFDNYDTLAWLYDELQPDGDLVELQALLRFIYEKREIYEALEDHYPHIYNVSKHIDSIHRVAEVADEIKTVSDIEEAVVVVANHASLLLLMLTTVKEFTSIYYGKYSTKPTMRPDNTYPVEGDMFYYVPEEILYLYNGTEFERITRRVEEVAEQYSIAVEKTVNVPGSDIITLSTLEIDPVGPISHWIHIDGVFQHDSFVCNADGTPTSGSSKYINVGCSELTETLPVMVQALHVVQAGTAQETECCDATWVDLLEYFDSNVYDIGFLPDDRRWSEVVELAISVTADGLAGDRIGSEHYVGYFEQDAKFQCNAVSGGNQYGLVFTLSTDKAWTAQSLVGNTRLTSAHVKFGEWE